MLSNNAYLGNTKAHTMKITYTISSQCPTTGRFLDNAQYDNLNYAQIHYDAFDINCRNKFQKIVTNGNNDTYTIIEETA